MPQYMCAKTVYTPTAPDARTERAGYHLPGRAPRLRKTRGNSGSHQTQPGRDCLRGNGIRKNHSAAQNMSRTRTGNKRTDRTHPAPQNRGTRGSRENLARTGHADGRNCRISGQIQRNRVGKYINQTDDRRHFARRNPIRSPSPALRHNYYRRSPRAVAQHRFSPWISGKSPAQTKRSETDRHFRNHRLAKICGPFRPAPLRRHGREQSAGYQRHRTHISGGNTLSPAGKRISAG